MFKWLGQRRETRKEQTKKLWGRDFRIVAEGLDEEEVVSFVNELRKQNEVSAPTSVRSVLQKAVADAEQIVANIKLRAQGEAEEAAAQIIAQAHQEAEKIQAKPETVGEKEPEVGLSVSKVAAEAVRIKKKPKTSRRVKRGKPVLVPPAVEQRVATPAPPPPEVVVSEPSAVTVEELLEPHPTEEKRGRELVGPALPKTDSHPLYTGEVEIEITAPVDPKVVSKLYGYLQMTPEIKFVRTTGSWDRGTTVTVVLDKPVPLLSVLSAKIPEAEASPERPDQDGFIKGRKGVRRIKISRKEG